LKEKGHAAEVGGNVWHDNFAFEQAQREEQMLLSQIRDLKVVLAEARVVDPPENPEALTLGCTAEVEIEGRGRRIITLVGYGEGDPARGWVAYNTPLGACLLGARPGERRTYTVDNREVTVTVLRLGVSQ
jgi:transcription elongation GreA/GreB family factor